MPHSESSAFSGVRKHAPAPHLSDPEQGLRVLVLAPYGRDARLTATLLQEAGMHCLPCADLAEVCACTEEGCGAWLLSEETLDNKSLALAQERLAAQPSWSDVPVILITRAGEISSAHDHRLAAMKAIGNVTLLERPFRPSTLISTVAMALRSRLRQYQVRDLLAQTARDAEALRDASRRKDEFLAMLAHELRNPLSSISHAVTLQCDSNALDADRDWAARVIARQTAQLSRLVDDLLDVSRITQGKINLLMETVDAAHILASACQTVSGLLAERAHSLRTQFPPSGLWLNADAARIEQIVVNLLTNAAKYTPDHGRIWVSGKLEADTVVIAVRDSGVGIPAERIADMFEMFTQGDRKPGRAEGGLGIGLPVVRSLCELHGGSVSAESAGVGKGSTFTVRLPAAAPPQAAAPVRREHLESTSGARILVVDDNVDSALGLARLLRRRGYTVDVAHDGPSALECAQASPPAVVLLDIGLPGMDGYEVARRMRAGAVCRGTLLVALTGYGQEEDRAHAHAAGFDHHCVKPIDFQVLLQLLHDRIASSGQA